MSHDITDTKLELGHVIPTCYTDLHFKYFYLRIYGYSTGLSDRKCADYKELAKCIFLKINQDMLCSARHE